MANWRTTADLMDAVLHRCGEVTNGTSTYEPNALQYLNSVYRSIIAGGNEFDVDCGEPWIWAQATEPQLLKLVEPFAEGSVVLAQGSVTAALSDPPSYSLEGYFLSVDGFPEWYRITAHIAGQPTLTLDQEWLGASTTSASFRAVRTDYELAIPVTRLVGPLMCYRDNLSVLGQAERGQIYEIDANTMSRKFPRMLLQAGVPDKFCVIAQDTDGRITVRFNSFPLEAMRVEVPYISVVPDLTDSQDSIPLLPIGFRELLVYGASYYLMKDKNDNRAETEFQLAQRKLQALIAHNRKSLSLAGSSYGRLIPRRTGEQRRYTYQGS